MLYFPINGDLVIYEGVGKVMNVLFDDGYYELCITNDDSIKIINYEYWKLIIIKNSSYIRNEYKKMILRTFYNMWIAGHNPLDY